MNLIVFAFLTDKKIFYFIHTTDCTQERGKEFALHL